MRYEPTRIRDDRGEVASWLILIAGLCLAAVVASGAIAGVFDQLARNVGEAAESEAAAGPGTGPVEVPDGSTVLPDGSVILPDGTIVQPDGTVVQPDGTLIHPDNTVVQPDGTVIRPDGTVIGPDGSVVHPDGTVVLADGTIILPDGTTELPDGTIVKPNGTVILPDGTIHVPQQDVPPHLQDVYDAITHTIDYGDDNDISAEGLAQIIETLASLSPADREALLAALSLEQLDRLFHNVDSSSILSDDLSDKDRAAFYTLLRDLSDDQQTRLGDVTDYFELYDSDYRPIDVPISEPEYVSQYEAIVNLPIDDFLALRAYMWDNPDLVAESPFDWYADGCSIPGGQYPGPLNGPCLRHDFAYSNARQAGARFPDGGYQDVGGNGIGDDWKNAADEILHDDIAAIPPWELPGSEEWADIVYTGVAVDSLGGAGLGSGKETFESEYVPDERFYGPGYDVDLGQDGDFEDRDDYDDLIAIATSGG